VRGPEQRRGWLDTLLIQLEPVYAHILQQYNQVLRQRNAFKAATTRNTPVLDQTEFALWNAQLATTGSR